MSFPTSPTNGQIAVVNNVAYEYASANTSWTRVLSIANIIQANVISANVLNVVQAFSIAGNIATANYFIGNGAFLTGLPVSYSNTDVANYLPTYTGNLVSLTGPVTTTSNVTGGNILFGTGIVSGTGTVYAATVSTTGNVNSSNISTGQASVGNLISGGYVSATGNITGGNLSGTNIVGTLTTASQTNITSVGTLGALTVTANTTSGNLLTGGLISATGNIIGGNLSGTNIVGTLTTAAQTNITSVGTLSSLTVTANTTSGNLLTNGIVSAAGNVTGNYILGNGALLTGVITSVANINNGTSNVTVVSSGGNVTVGVAGISNVAVFSADAVTVKGNLLPSANITYDLGTSTQRWRDLWLSNSTIYLGNAQISANATAVTITNPAGGTTVLQGSTPIITAAIISASGNVTGGNLLTGGVISATGNITGSYILGNGSQLTGIDATSIQNGTSNVRVVSSGGNVSVGVGGTSNVAVWSTTGEYVTGVISATGNITGGNLSGTNIVGTLTTASQTNITSVGTLGALTVTANTTSGNLLTGGLINATGNITGGNVNTNQVVGTGLTLVSIGDLTFSATGNINANNEYINNVPTPVADGDAVNKLYVDNFVTGLNVHDAVTAATPTTLATITSGAITYYNGPGSNGTGATLTTTGTFDLIDTVNVQTAGTRILVLNEANAVTNGVYVWSNATAITRASDYNSLPEVEAGDFMFVTSGNAYGNTGWIQTSTVSNIGYAGNNITFTQFSGSGTYNAGTGLTLTGTTFSVNASQTQVTSVGTLGSLTVTANTTSGNLLTGGLINATGNITGGNLSGTNIVGTLATASQPNITSVGTLGSLTVTANVTGGNVLTAGLISATGNITGGNVISDGVRVYKWTTVANTAPSGAVPGDNWYDSYAEKLYLYVNDGTGNAWVDQSPPTTFASLTVTGNTSSGNLLTAGLVSATGNITGDYIFGNGALLTGVITSVSNINSGTSNVTVVSSGGNISVGVGGTGNVAVFATTGEYVTGLISASGNITGGNLITAGQVSATGNVTGNYILGNGALLTGVITSVSNINSGTSNVTVVSSGGNVSIGVGGTSNVAVFATTGEYVTGVISASGNITGGNLITAGLVSATGNITGAYFIGNGSQLTSLPAIKWTTVANTAPASPAPGDFWYNSTTGIKYQYINDGTSNAWVDQSYPTTFSTLAVTGNITAGNLSVSTGTVTLGNIVNANGNGVGNIGSSSLYFNTVFAKATSAQYADLAEMYVADQDYPAGTVVEFGGNFEITATTQTHTPRIAGVVSTNPSYLMNSTLAGEYVLPIALTGRVPCKVSGTVRKGDQMVASSTPGIAMALDKQLYEPGCVIGKALENYNSDTVGTIEVAVGRY